MQDFVHCRMIFKGRPFNNDTGDIMINVSTVAFWCKMSFFRLKQAVFSKFFFASTVKVEFSKEKVIQDARGKLFFRGLKLRGAAFRASLCSRCQCFKRGKKITSGIRGYGKNVMIPLFRFRVHISFCKFGTRLST